MMTHGVMMFSEMRDSWSAPMFASWAVLAILSLIRMRKVK